MSCLQGHFTWIFSMKTLPDLSCIWKPIKWAFQNWSYMPKKSIFWGSYALLKFVHDKRKLDCFHQGNTEIFVFHKQTLREKRPRRRTVFWTIFSNNHMYFKCSSIISRIIRIIGITRIIRIIGIEYVILNI